MNSSASRLISPPKPRVRGGQRKGAGRKKKSTPLKQDLRTVNRLNWRRRCRAKWLSVQKQLLILTKNGDFGEEYSQLRAKYTDLRKRLGLAVEDSEENEPSDEGGSDTDAESSGVPISGHISPIISSSESEVQ